MKLAALLIPNLKDVNVFHFLLYLAQEAKTK